MENNDEIDLLELLKKSVQWIHRNFKGISVSILLGAIVGFCYFYFSPKTYEGRMVVSSEILTEAFCFRVFGELNESIKEKSFEEVAEKLQISSSEAALLKSIRVETNIKEKIANQEKNFFLIIVRTTGKKILPNLQASITKFLLGNNYIKIKVNERRKLIDLIEVELQSLQDLKSRVYKGDLFEKAKGNVMFDPTEINTKSIQMNERRTKLELELEGGGIQLVQGFSKSSMPVWPSLLISIGGGIAFGLFILLILLVGKFVFQLSKD